MKDQTYYRDDENGKQRNNFDDIRDLRDEYEV